MKLTPDIKRELVASGVASVGAIGLAVSGLPLLIVGAGAVGCYIGVRSIIPAPQTDGERLEELRREAARYESHIKEKLHHLINHQATLPEAGRSSIAKIVETSRYILIDIKDHPHKLQEAQFYLNHHLESTAKILSKYRELVAKKSDRAAKYEVRILELLERVAVSFENGKRSLLDEDVVTLESEIEILDTTLELES